MKPFMLRHKHNWLPKKLQYGVPYWIGFIGVSHEGFEFILKRNVKAVQIRDNKGIYTWSKKQLREDFQDGLLQFCVELEESSY